MPRSKAGDWQGRPRVRSDLREFEDEDELRVRLKNVCAYPIVIVLAGVGFSPLTSHFLPLTSHPHPHLTLTRSPNGGGRGIFLDQRDQVVGGILDGGNVGLGERLIRGEFLAHVV